jgi:two-component system NtrC family sensor kinase
MLSATAADAVEKNGTITIDTGMEKGYVSITVADTGCGIDREKMDKLFIPFFTTKPAGKGTGLGLSVSYGIVENHGGRISVESIPGKGSVFTVQLPSV